MPFKMTLSVAQGVSNGTIPFVVGVGRG